MRFVETPIFTEAIEDVLDHDSDRSLQLLLILRPEGGAVIRGSGGLRKIRWALPGKAKRTRSRGESDSRSAVNRVRRHESRFSRQKTRGNPGGCVGVVGRMALA